MSRVTEVMDYLTEKELLDYFLRTSKAKREAIGKEALRIGTLVDEMVGSDIKDGGYLIPGEELQIANCMKAWEKFKVEEPWMVPSIASMQDELVDGELVGHPDFIIQQEHRVGIIDLKTSKSIYPRYWTQCAQYLHMKWPRLVGNHFIGVLRLDKETGLYEYKEIDGKEYIQYEIGVFNAYWTAFQHNVKNREQIRRMLEEELNVS